MADLQRGHPELALTFRGTRGFPSAIQDDSLMQLILGESDAYPDAEERRLLYVALTRARRRVTVVANDGPDSVFTRELSGSEYGRWVEEMCFLAPKGTGSASGNA